MNQLECVAVRLSAFVGESDQIGGQTGDDALNDPVARGLLA